MRKLRESERSQQIRTLTPRIEDKIHHDEHVADLCKIECSDEESSATELERLKELALEQQEVIEVLRQAVKDKERKLEQLVKKRRKEEFYKQWLDLEPVAEAEEIDDDDHQLSMQMQMHDSTSSDSALGSAPSSLSPQPDCIMATSTCSSSDGMTFTSPTNTMTPCVSGVTREAYESLLLEIDELQTRLLEEQRELSLAKSQVRDLEKALLQETRGSQNSRRALSEKLRDAEEREASLVSELSELREQNELLEFRVLELEESPNQRETPDLADSGVVSPEPIHLYKDAASARQHQHRDRAVATVIPYTSNAPTALPNSGPEKSLLSLQESGIFEADDDDNDSTITIPALITSNPETTNTETKSHHTSRTTQTEAPTSTGDAGELLQEVQRLQELRARIIQERASSSSTSSCTSDDNSSSNTSSLNRLQHLEERLRNLETERKEAKVREEELLDENYRLSERAYWLEAQLSKMKIGDRKEVATLTDEIFEEQGNSCGSCGEKWRDYEIRIQNLGKSELGLRQQIASLEQRESAFLETLKQADATWAKLETEYEAKLADVGSRLEVQVENNRKLAAELAKIREEPVEERRRSGCGCCGLTGASVGTRAESRKQVERLDRDETDGKAKLTIEVPGCTELATEAKEDLAKSTPELQQKQQQQQEKVAPSASTTTTTGICNDKVSSQVKRRPVIGFERNRFTPIRSRHRLTLYQEICV
ncbi:hypothetical protein QAD02_008745 [Eretmocerus hayati]|uniref:Uncharacterized protein n=1 Tax=Eretmocerus hayati TaxID=131215 RepID=A0ACC2N8L9_9HYME|nr:hypothetical protein QAD02_008745 [Eretmocerus hayati]